MIHKQLQQKIYPAMRERINTQSKPMPPGVTYSQALKHNSQPPQTIQEVYQSHTPGTIQKTPELIELKQMMQKLMEQMGTMLNLITTLITKIA
jgi:hypothetical protein